MRIRRFLFSLVLILPLLSAALLSAQDTISLPETATLTDDTLTVSIDHPEGWEVFSDDTALYLADRAPALEAIVAGSGSMARKSLGIVVYAPGTASALDVPADASTDEALAVFLESMALSSYSGTIYEGNPAISFGVGRVQDDGEVSFDPIIEGAAIDAFAFERDGTIVFVLLYGTDDHFALSEAMWETLAVTPADVAADVETAADPDLLTGEVAIPVTDEDGAFTFSAALAEEWIGRFDESSGTVILASSENALRVAAGDGERFERGETAFTIILPPALRALDIDPLDAPDAVLTAYATSIGLEAYPSLLDGFDAPTAQAYVSGDLFSEGQAAIYTFGFPDGAVVVIVQEINGGSNMNTNAVLESLRYGMEG